MVGSNNGSKSPALTGLPRDGSLFLFRPSLSAIFWSVENILARQWDTGWNTGGGVLMSGLHVSSYTLVELWSRTSASSSLRQSSLFPSNATATTKMSTNWTNYRSLVLMTLQRCEHWLRGCRGAAVSTGKQTILNNLQDILYCRQHLWTIVVDHAMVVHNG